MKSASGQPVAGAYVKVADADKGLTIMVVSQEQGRYTAKNLPVGKYTAQAIGGEFQSDKMPVDVTGAKPAMADLSLSNQRAPALAPGWPGTPGVVGGGEEWSKNPIPDLPEGPGADIALAKCGQCHAPSWFLSFRGERDNWAALIDSMRSNIAANRTAKDFTEAELKTLTDYFAAHFSRPRPDENSRLPRTLAKGIETKYVVVDYKIPRIEAESHEMTVDARGNGVVGERNSGLVGMLNPDTYEFKEFTPPAAASPRVRIGAISKGRGDTVWMLDGGPNRRWMELNTVTGDFRSFAGAGGHQGVGKRQHHTPASERNGVGGQRRRQRHGWAWTRRPASSRCIRRRTESSPARVSGPTASRSMAAAASGLPNTPTTAWAAWIRKPGKSTNTNRRSPVPFLEKSGSITTETSGSRFTKPGNSGRSITRIHRT